MLLLTTFTLETIVTPAIDLEFYLGTTDIDVPAQRCNQEDLIMSTSTLEVGLSKVVLRAPTK